MDVKDGCEKQYTLLHMQSVTKISLQEYKYNENFMKINENSFCCTSVSIIVVLCMLKYLTLFLTLLIHLMKP